LIVRTVQKPPMNDDSSTNRGASSKTRWDKMRSAAATAFNCLQGHVCDVRE